MGRWIVDGVDISTLAWNVSNRGGSWTVPGLRGENEDVANSHGRRYVPGKTFEEGKAHLEMWALGSNPDGTFPTSQTRQYTCRQNLQTLMSLFTRVTGLIDVMRIESTGYGLVNQHTNPGAEGFTIGAVAYRNEVLNPYMGATGVVPQNSNLIIDPNVQTNTGWYEYGHNLEHDAYNKQHRLDTPAYVDRNYVGTGSFETYAAGATISSASWTAGTNVAALTAQTISGGRGARVMQVLASGAITALAVIATRVRAAIPTGTNPYLRFKVRRIGTGSTTRTLGYRLNYVNNSNVVTVAGTWNTVTIPTLGTWLDVSLPNLAATNTDGNFTLEFRAGEAWSAAEGIYLDGVIVGTAVGVAGVAGPYFDGDDTFGAWAGTVGAAISDWKEVTLPEWAPVAQTAYHARAVIAGTATMSQIGFVAFSHTASGTQQFWKDADTTVDPGVPYNLFFNARAVASGCTVELMYSDDAGGSWTSAVSKTVTTHGYIAGARGGEQITTSTGTFAAWDTYNGEGVMGQAGRTFAVRVSVPVQTNGNHALQIYGLGVTDTPGWGAYGDAAPTSNTQYAWEDTAYASRTLILKRRSVGFTGRHAMTDQGTLVPWPAVEVAARGLSDPTALYLADIVPDQTALDDGVYLYGEFISTNVSYASPCQVRAVIDCYDATNTLVGTFTGSTATTNEYVTGTEGVVAASLLVPTLTTGTTVMRCRFELVSPTFGQVLQGGHFMLNDRNANVGWVTGALPPITGFTYSWAGAANASVSVKSATAAPTNYRVVRGLVSNDAGYLKVYSTIQPDVSIESSVTIPTAGVINVGAACACELDADWYAQVVVSGTVAAEAFLGSTVAVAALTTTQLQTVVASPGGMTAVRIVARPPAGGSWAYNKQFRFDQVYAWLNSGSGNPRQDGNRVTNAQFKSSFGGWTVTADPQVSADATGLSIVSTTFGTALKATGKTQLSSRSRMAIVAGEQIFVWSKVRCSKAYQLRVWWYTSADVLISTVTAASDTTGVTTNSNTLTAPATTGYARVQIWLTTAASGTDTIEIFGLYMVKVAASRDYSTALDPTTWRYVDGGMGSDWLGRPATWEGAAVTSRTNVFPNVVTGWDTTLTSSSAPAFRPPGSTGRAVVLPAPAVEFVTNPGFEVDLTGWTETDPTSILTLTRDTGTVRTGVGSLKMAYTGGGAGQSSIAQNTVTGLVVGQNYTVSAWCYNPTGSTAIAPYIGHNAGSGTSATTPLPANTWTQRTVTFTATATSAVFWIGNSGVTGAGQATYVDDVSVRASGVTAISTPVATPSAYLSGEIAVAARDANVSIVVNVYGYDDASRTNPVLLASKTMPALPAAQPSQVVTWRDLVNTQPYAGIQVVYTELVTGGTGTGATLDNLLVISSPQPLAADYPGYFDGDTSSANWNGTKYASTSTYYAGALEAWCERQGQIDIEAQAGATRAEFAVDLVIPAAFWADVSDRQTVATVTTLPGTITLADFAGGNAPIEDAVIDVTMVAGNSPAGGIIITDVMSGTWVRYAEQLLAGKTVRFDCKVLDVIYQPGQTDQATKIRKVTKGGDARFFTLNPGIAGGAPQLQVSSTSSTFDGQIQVTVTGRRKYVIA
jgi:hypothetical protein